MNKMTGVIALTTAISCSTAMADSKTFQHSETKSGEIATILLAKNGTPMYNNETKEEISQEAQQLMEDLKSTLEHTTKLTKKIGTPIIGRINNWIQKNYDKLPEDKKEKIKGFVAEVKLDVKASIGFFKKLIRDFIKIRRDIEKDNKTKSHSNDRKNTTGVIA